MFCELTGLIGVVLWPHVMSPGAIAKYPNSQRVTPKAADWQWLALDAQLRLSSGAPWFSFSWSLHRASAPAGFQAAIKVEISSSLKAWVFLARASLPSRAAETSSSWGVAHVGRTGEGSGEETALWRLYWSPSLLFSHWVMSGCLQPMDAAHQASLSFTISQSLPKLMSIESVMPSNHLILLSHPSPPAFNLSQHQGLFQWVGSSHQAARLLEIQLQHQSFQWIFRIDSFMIDWFDLFVVQETLKSLLQNHNSKASIL